LETNLRQIILPRATALDLRREQMDSLEHVRRYIWNDGDGNPLQDVWYSRYLVPPIEKLKNAPPDADKRQVALRQFFWRVRADADGAIQAQLVLVGENAEIALDETPSAIHAFERAMLDLANRHCAPIVAEESLAEIIAATAFNEDNTRASIAALLDGSKVQLQLRSEMLRAAIPNLVIAANEAVDLTRLQQEATERSGRIGATGYKRLDVTDPYSVTVNQRIAAVPLEAIESLERAHGAYRANHNLLNQANARKNDRPTLSAVYEAEAVALDLEALIRERLRESPMLLHPVVVASLTDAQRTLSFYLALAAGELETRKVKGQDRFVLSLVTDSETRDFPLAPQGEHPLIGGLVAFLNDQARFPNEFVDVLAQRYQSDDYTGVFTTFYRRGWKDWADELDNYDERSTVIVSDILRVARLYADRFSR